MRRTHAYSADTMGLHGHASPFRTDPADACVLEGSPGLNCGSANPPLPKGHYEGLGFDKVLASGVSCRVAHRVAWDYASAANMKSSVPAQQPQEVDGFTCRSKGKTIPIVYCRRGSATVAAVSNGE